MRTVYYTKSDEERVQILALSLSILLDPLFYSTSKKYFGWTKLEQGSIGEGKEGNNITSPSISPPTSINLAFPKASFSAGAEVQRGQLKVDFISLE